MLAASSLRAPLVDWDDGALVPDPVDDPDVPVPEELELGFPAIVAFAPRRVPLYAKPRWKALI